MRRLIPTLALATAALAQAPLVPTLIEYLDLTATQITRLRQNAADFNRFYAEKSARYQQVQRELSEELDREVLDALGIGQRYVEQEAICRELRAAHDQNFERNQAVLTAAQRTRIQALETVATNAALARSAQSANLIEGSPDLFGRFSLLELIAAPGSPTSNVIPICGVPTVSSNPTLRAPVKETK